MSWASRDDGGMADWTTLGAGLVGAAAAIAGSLGGQVFRSRNETSREVKERHLRFRDMRRSAYADLLAVSSRLISVTDQVDASSTVSGVASLHEALHRATALAELYATPENWEEMKQLPMLAISGERQESVNVLRDKYVLAARADLSI